jgi:hypothetical protein
LAALWTDAAQLLTDETGEENDAPFHTLICNHGTYRNLPHAHLKLRFDDAVFARAIQALCERMQSNQISTKKKEIISNHHLFFTRHTKILFSGLDHQRCFYTKSPKYVKNMPSLNPPTYFSRAYHFSLRHLHLHIGTRGTVAVGRAQASGGRAIGGVQRRRRARAQRDWRRSRRQRRWMLRTAVKEGYCGRKCTVNCGRVLWMRARSEMDC